MIKALVLIAACVCSALAQQEKDYHYEARAILKGLVEINTTAKNGSTRKAAEALAARFRASGFPAEDVTITGPEGSHANLVVRLRGASETEKPVLLLAHLDVVEALRSDWSTDPFTLVQKDGRLYGRGVDDDKAGVAVIAANLLRLKKEGFVPQRDLYAFFTCDEETTAENGILALIRDIPTAKRAAYALNADGGGGYLLKGKKVAYGIQTSEKVYADYELKATDRGGHSSLPRNEANPIYRLAAALTKLRSHNFPVNLNDTTRQMVLAMSRFESGQLAKDLRDAAAETATPDALLRLSKNPGANAIMRTTCVATQLHGGHAPNALPQTATANVNCRILPNDDVSRIKDALVAAIGDPTITVDFASGSRPVPSPPSPVGSTAYRLIERAVAKTFAGVPITPEMSTGATDGLYLRNAGVPVYGAMGLFGEIGASTAHGKDENIEIENFYEALDLWYELVRSSGSRQ